MDDQCRHKPVSDFSELSKMEFLKFKLTFRCRYCGALIKQEKDLSIMEHIIIVVVQATALTFISTFVTKRLYRLYLIIPVLIIDYTVTISIELIIRHFSKYEEIGEPE
jgi:hypothetical protein